MSVTATHAPSDTNARAIAAPMPAAAPDTNATFSFSRCMCHSFISGKAQFLRKTEKLGVDRFCIYHYGYLTKRLNTV
jgi:hypothetical protein